MYLHRVLKSLEHPNNAVSAQMILKKQIISIIIIVDKNKFYLIKVVDTDC